MAGDAEVAAQRLGERFEPASARCRIGDAGEVRFIEQDQLRIACDPAGEGIG